MPEENEGQDGQSQQQAEENYVRMKREDINRLQESAKKAQEADALQREVLFLRTGIPTDSALGKLFFKSYDGELNTEAIKTAAQEIGLLEKTEKNPPLAEGEAKSTQERQALSNNATPGGETPDKHPSLEAREMAEGVIKQGGTFEQAGAAFLSTLMKRVQDGDKRAIVNERERQRPISY